MMLFISISLKHCYLWFILATPVQAHQLFFCLTFSFRSFIALLWIQSTSHLLCILFDTLPYVCCFAKLGLFVTTNLQACLVGLMFCFWAGNLHNYSIHSIGSCCNLREHPLNHFFLTVSHPPLPPLVLLSSDNHPGSAPILQLAASSFQNAGAPPHETKSKFQRRLRTVMLFCRHVNINTQAMFLSIGGLNTVWINTVYGCTSIQPCPASS